MQVLAERNTPLGWGRDFLKKLGFEVTTESSSSGYFYNRYVDFKAGFRFDIFSTNSGILFRIFNKSLVLVDLAQEKSFCTIASWRFFKANPFFFETLTFKCVYPENEISKVPGDWQRKSYFQDIFADPKILKEAIKRLTQELKKISDVKQKFNEGVQFTISLENLKEVAV